MKKWILLLITGLFLVSPSYAGEIDDVKVLGANTVNAVIAVLKEKDTPKKVRGDKILKIVEPVFDFTRMAQFSLGKRGYKSMNKKERKEYLKLFITQLKSFYLSKLDLYDDQKVVIDSATKVKSKIEVKAYLISADDRSQMIFKFYKNKRKGWLVYDVELFGVSIVHSNKIQLDGLLKKGGKAAVLKYLREAKMTQPAG